MLFAYTSRNHSDQGTGSDEEGTGRQCAEVEAEHMGSWFTIDLQELCTIFWHVEHAIGVADQRLLHLTGGKEFDFGLYERI